MGRQRSNAPLGFNRFMDAAVGTNWRSTVDARHLTVILRGWNRGTMFKRLRWDQIRDKIATIRTEH